MGTQTCDAPTDPSIEVNVVYVSGKKLLHDVNVSLVNNVAHLLNLANEELHKDPALASNCVSHLVSENGSILEDTATIEESNLIQGSTVTAVVFLDELSKIEKLFHDLIRQINPALQNKAPQWEFPSLIKHVENQEHDGQSEWTNFYAVPGMYGGFNTTLHKDDSAEAGSQWKLTCESWCRVVEGSGQAHEITFHGGTKLTGQGFC
eukprot:gnl/MRDRNA2_/MRDRNA2_123452_c0_seq1.p1 gnl/MRDRNA2_/MRDRNA2_123452_c0~~gnl/MRDRNA2_/MRDRNA2_123452_c0_seq1.p1  ORF type:complete len:206 (-),score=40.20 gnl/MRDRNA2_/MRDRNA2_123452_c0_seq1:66-683(-)